MEISNKYKGENMTQEKSSTKGVRFNSEDLDQIEQQIENYKMSFSDYVKRLIENDLFYNDIFLRHSARAIITQVKEQENALKLDGNELLKYVIEMYKQPINLKPLNQVKPVSLDSEL